MLAAIGIAAHSSTPGRNSTFAAVALTVISDRPRPSRRRLKLRRSLPYLPVDSRVLERRGSPESGRFPDSGRRRDACCRHHRAVPESADHPAVVEPPRANGGELLLLLSFLPRPSPSPSPATAPSPCALPPLPPSPHVQHAPGLAPSLAGQKAGWLGQGPGLAPVWAQPGLAIGRPKAGLFGLPPGLGPGLAGLEAGLSGFPFFFFGAKTKSNN